MKIEASDNGQPSLTGRTTLRVHLSNVNDESPTFSSSLQLILRLPSASPIHTPLYVVQAFDPDGDSVKYSFKGGL